MTSERQTICFLMKQLMSQNWKFPVFLTLRALLISATTFCTVLFSSSILEKIQSGSVKELLIVFVVVWLTVLLLLQLIQAVLDYWVETRKRSLIEEQNSRIDRQSMKREFEWLGDFGVQEKMREQDEYTNMTGGGLKVFVTLWEKGAKALFDIFFAVVLMLLPFWQNRMGKHVWYGILLAATVLVSALINQRLQKKLNEATKQYFQDCIEGNSISVYYLYNILFRYETGKDLRIFKQERFILDGIQKAIDMYAAAGRKYATVCRKKKYVTVTISAVSSGLVFVCVGTQAYFGTIGVGDILRIAGGISSFTVGIAVIFDVLSETTLLKEYARKFLDLLQSEEKAEKPSVLVNQVECPILECKNIHFQYPGTTVDILKGINMTIRKGERIALVGRNGSGKTTLIKILCGLYHATKETIQWKGIDNQEVTSEQYFKEFACVF